MLKNVGACFNKAYPQEKLVNQRLMHWGFIRAKLTWRKGNTQFQSALVFLVREEKVHNSKGVCQVAV